MQEYDQRLTLYQEENLQFKLGEDPFSKDPEEVPIQLQLEVIELQASFVCKTKHKESSLLNFYRSLNYKPCPICKESTEYFWQYQHVQTNFFDYEYEQVQAVLFFV